MNHLFFFLPFLLLPFTILANPTPNNDCDGDCPRDGCLNNGQANKLLWTWISFFVKIDPAVAERTLTPDFQYYSDSDNFLAIYGRNAIGNVTISGREAFIAAQVQQTGSNGDNKFEVLNWFFDCSHFAFRWRLPGTPFALTGIDMVTLKDGSFLIEKAESEYNSAIEFWNVGFCDLTVAGCVPSSG